MEQLMGYLYTIISFIGVIIVIVFVHELGHFLVARLFGIGVKEFAIGFGKKLYSRRKGETEYTIRAIPLGGFCDLLGMDPNEEAVDPEKAFYSKSPMARFLVLLAGPSMNFVLALFLFIFMYAAMGTIEYMDSTQPIVAAVYKDGPGHKAGLKPQDRILSINQVEITEFQQIDEVAASFVGQDIPISIYRQPSGEIALSIRPESNHKELGILGIVSDYEPIVDVAPGQAADQAGLKTGDRILKIDNKTVNSWMDIPITISETPEGAKINMLVQRGQKTLDIVVIPQFISMGDDARPMIGVSPATVIGPPTAFGEAVHRGAYEVVYITQSMLSSLWNMVKGKVSATALSGPVGIAGIVGEKAKQGATSLIRITGLLSLNIGLINLVPFPALDGSRMLFIFLEILFRRKLASRIEESIHFAGLAVLILLIIFVSFQDIQKLFVKLVGQ